MPSNGRGQFSRNHTVTSKPYLKPMPSMGPVSPTPIDYSDSIRSPSVSAPDTTNKPGFPTYAHYKRIEAAYLCSLSPRKRDKALITQIMFDKIWDVLHQPEACTIETPQFRFWVRKMFTLSRPQGHLIGSSDNHIYELPPVVLHENRPVAVMEQLYELFCYCHEQANHGGRDKTCAVIRQHYSWVPKELTSQFVKACPTCVLKRSGNPDLVTLAQEQPQTVKATDGQDQVGAIATTWPCSGGPLDPLPVLVVHTKDSADAMRNHSIDLQSHEASKESTFAVDCPERRNANDQGPPWLPPPATNLSAVPTLELQHRIHLPSVADVMDKNYTGLPSIRRVLSDNVEDTRCALRELWPENAGESLPPALQYLRIARPAPGQASFVLRIDPVLLAMDQSGCNAQSELRAQAVPAAHSATLPLSPALPPIGQVGRVEEGLTKERTSSFLSFAALPGDRSLGTSTFVSSA